MVEDNVSNVVNTARLPLFDLVLIVVVVVAQVNAGNSTGVVLGTLLLVDDGIDQAEDGPLQEALVDSKLHSSLFFFWSPALVGFGWRIVPDDILMEETVDDIRL